MEIAEFVVSRVFTKEFWGFVASSAVGIVLLSCRNHFRSGVYKAAVEWHKGNRDVSF